MKRLLVGSIGVLLLIVLTGCNLFNPGKSDDDGMGIVKGEVHLFNGGAAIGAKVTVGELVALTNEVGEFEIVSLPYGTHTVAIAVGDESYTYQVDVNRRTVDMGAIDLPTQLLFVEDFSIYDLGSVPYAWDIEPAGVSEYTNLTDIAEVELIEDPDAPSGRALRVQVYDKEQWELPVISPQWIAGENVSKLAFEFNYKGGASNSYIRVTRRPSISFPLGARAGWHRIRIEADLQKNEVTVYVNDGENPASGPNEFREKPDTWDAETEFRFLVPPETEIYFADFRAWVIE